LRPSTVDRFECQQVSLRFLWAFYLPNLQMIIYGE
jgi:hypothetical protein